MAGKGRALPVREGELWKMTLLKLGPRKCGKSEESGHGSKGEEENRR